MQNTRAYVDDALPAVVDYPPAVPALLAFVAGYVDVTTFLAFNGLFVAQATGSLVVAGAAVETGGAAFVKVAAIPVFFLAGIATTFAINAFRTDKPRAFAVMLLGEAAIIAAMVMTTIFLPRDATVAPLFGLAAMGVQSALARLLLSTYGSTNVMTSNITQFSIDVEMTLSGLVRGQPTRSALSGVEQLGLIIVTFTLGIVVGAIGYTIAGMGGLVLMVATLVAMAAWVAADGLHRPGKGEQNA
jgi:uncharacterized membrane protein YoaK (UPF0700 family)